MLNYEAISYCWGDISLPRNIQITGRGDVGLTESLHAALQSLRYPDRPRRLWTDLLCINQEDVSERSVQVAMMGAIYSTAEKVLVWLGPCLEDGTETLAFAMLGAPVVAKSNETRSKLLRILARHLKNTKHCACCGDAIGMHRPIRLEDGIAAVAKLLERPYFERLWIVQEVALAKEVEVHCGSHFCPWQVFTEIAKAPGKFEGENDHDGRGTADTLPRSELRRMWARCNFLNQLRARNKPLTLARDSTSNFRPTQICKDLLMLSHLRCRDPHDRIFGVSRVLGLDQFDELRADYTISIAELYRRTIALYLTAPANHYRGRAVLALALAGTESSEAGALCRPSWVPHLQYLSGRSRAKYSYYEWTLDDPQHAADGMGFRCKILSQKPQELQIRAKHIAVIKSVLDDSACPSKHVERRSSHKCSSDEGIALVNWHMRCRQFLCSNTALQDQHRLVVKENGFEQLLRGIFACDPEHRFRNDMPHVQPDIVQRWLSVMTPQVAKTSLKLSHLVEDLRPYITGHPIDRDRSLCIVEGDLGIHAAWAPPNARAGDYIYYIAGAPYPFVLRPRQDDSFQLLGDSFVEGAGKAEFLDLDPDTFTSLASESAETSTSIEPWVEAKQRATIKPDRYNTVHPKEHRQDDQGMTRNRQAWMARMQEVFRQAHGNMPWIRLS